MKKLLRLLLPAALLLAPFASQAARFTCQTPVLFADSETQTATNAFDASDSTIWESDATPSYHSINCRFGSVKNITQICLTQRQTGTDGKVDEYQIFTSTDGIDWGAPVFAGTFTTATTEQCTNVSISTDYIRFVVVSQHAGTTATIAELEFDDGPNAPASAPGNFAAVEHSGNVDLSWNSVALANDYDLDYRLSTDTLWTDGSQAAALSDNIDGLTNDTKYDFRVAACNASGCGPYSQLDDIVPAVLADLIRAFTTGNTGDRVLLFKRKDSQFEDTAGTDEVDVTGDKILHADDLSGNADGWTQATALKEPDWDSDDGSFWNGSVTTDLHLDFDTSISISGEFLVCMVVTFNNSSNFQKYLRAGAQNALRRQSTTGTLWRVYTGTNRDVTFTTAPATGGNASTYLANTICFERTAGNTLRGYLQRIGADPDNPTDTSWVQQGSVSAATGAWAPSVVGNETGSGAPEGHIAGILIREKDFDDDAERTEIFGWLLDLWKL